MLTQLDIEKGLKEIGLRKGNVIILHSSLASLGQVSGGAETVVNAFLKVLGQTGTLVVPTFGSLGIITDVVKAHPKAVKSLHPYASIAAIGAHAKALCKDHWKAELAHEKDTPYTRLIEVGGYVCLLGVDQDRNTLLHTVEEILRLPYLKPTQETTFDTPKGTVTKSWPYFPGPHRDFIGLERLFRDSGKMRIGRIGDSVVRLIKSMDLIELALAAGRNNPAFVLCDNPNCGDCVIQRADLRRARLAQEAFQVATSAYLAGDYVPEIVESCQNAGINSVELDLLQGKPIEKYAVDKIARIVEELREGQVRVVALRGRSLGRAAKDLIAAAKASSVKRVVLPLAREAEHVLNLAREEGLVVSFYNTIFDSEESSVILLHLKQCGFLPGFTFSVTGFARLGENPFLGSYKKKLRRFVDQLDVEDGLYDGTLKALAQGNAEIKEMISILRCASFSGTMLLGAANRTTGTLVDTARRFIDLLESM